MSQHEITTTQTAAEIEAMDDNLLTTTHVWPDKFQPGDGMIITSKDGDVFLGEVEDVELYTGRVHTRLT